MIRDAAARAKPARYSPGDPRTRELREILARVYWSQRAIVDLLGRADLSPAEYPLEGAARLVWGEILASAYNRMELDRLLDEVEEDPAAKRWQERIQELRGPSPAAEAESQEPLEPPGRHEDELILGERSTLLDVAFLARGLEKAPSIVKLTVGWGEQSAHGSGCLIGERRVLTNHHVLFDAHNEPADRVAVWFNYERDVDGAPTQVDAYACDLSSIEGDRALDWAIVDVSEALRQPRRPLSLRPPSKPVEEGDRVYIIQHPLGGYKQIGMHHNVVTRVSHEHIQYMTDTDAGSSGSPVFNDRWEIVAIHHRFITVERGQPRARFSLDDRGRPGGGDVDYRNQGVRVERVIEGLAALKGSESRS